MDQTKTPAKAIRDHCLECCGGGNSFKTVAYCGCDGIHSTWCSLWSYRFGMRPATARQKIGAAMLTPELMPEADANLEDLPTNPRDYCRMVKQEPVAA